MDVCSVGSIGSAGVGGVAIDTRMALVGGLGEEYLKRLATLGIELIL
jgi:hypothetical protein